MKYYQLYFQSKKNPNEGRYFLCDKKGKVHKVSLENFNQISNDSNYINMGVREVLPYSDYNDKL